MKETIIKRWLSLKTIESSIYSENSLYSEQFN